ncbi:MAG: hypothetical protein J7500_12760 [Sphingomonas sp.]|uniref:hypothetical protein n=1 Tax=Sphingomonas sp. TaxID=28214 RepID=UPI001B1976B7|nr:hypothetical protein [Sphingomonas sp.]MBO9623572.1 hypothetical protein [Sphingomonas sp.]
MRAYVFLLAGAALALTSSPAEAQRRWVTLGSTTVGLGLDHDSIRVRNSGRHRQVRLCVSRNTVFINSYRVGFLRGGEQWVPVRMRLRPGTCSAITNLRRAPQSIRTVWLDFVRLRHGTRPVIRFEAR